MNGKGAAKIRSTTAQLSRKALRKWQKTQPIKHNEPPGYHRAIFDRVRFMIPEKDYLAQHVFEIDTLRSPSGIGVLNSMIALYKKSSGVEYRPGPERDKCSCGKINNGASYNWKHIYDCHKAALQANHEFAELCFECNEWFCGIEAWEMDCQRHFNNWNSLTVWYNPLVYSGVLATAGQCPWCRADERLPASARRYQFKNRRSWLEHIHEHKMKTHRRKVDHSIPRRASTMRARVLVSP